MGAEKPWRPRAVLSMSAQKRQPLVALAPGCSCSVVQCRLHVQTALRVMCDCCCARPCAVCAECHSQRRLHCWLLSLLSADRRAPAGAVAEVAEWAKAELLDDYCCCHRHCWCWQCWHGWWALLYSLCTSDSWMSARANFADTRNGSSGCTGASWRWSSVLCR